MIEGRRTVQADEGDVPLISWVDCLLRILIAALVKFLLEILVMALRCFRLWVVILVGAIAVPSCLVQSARATQYTVGGSDGWGLGHDLLLWASQYTFHVGDDLYFPYQTGQHSVLLVTQDDYNSCNTDHPVTSDNGQGNMIFTLINQQTYYFICGAPQHCSEGLKLEVTVEASPTTNTPATPLPTPTESPPVLSPPDSTQYPPPDALHYPPPDAVPYVPPPPHGTLYPPPYNTPYNTFHNVVGAASPCKLLEALVASILGAAAALAYTSLAL